MSKKRWIRPPEVYWSLSIRHTHAGTRCRHRIGVWTFPTGNALVAHLEGNGRGVWHHLTYEWTSLPLHAVDASHFAIVEPEVKQLVREFLTRTPRSASA